MSLNPADIPLGKPSHRNTLVIMEKTLDKIQLQLSKPLLSKYVDNINDAIEWLRSSDEANAENFKVERNAVLSHLREARKKLLTAHGEYNEKKDGQSEKFYNLVEAGRQELETALNAW